MKAQPYTKTSDGYAPCSPSDATHIALHLQAPLPNRMIPVSIFGQVKRAWYWNGDVDSPTIEPSILTKGGMYEGDKYTEYVCHSFIKEGKVQFLNDCTHEFAGQTLDLLDIEE